MQLVVYMCVPPCVCVYGHISATTPVLLLLIIECSVWTCAKSLELCAHLWGPDVHMCLCMFRGVLYVSNVIYVSPCFWRH